jgi:membrane-associated protease RseP (regulator of RpoE activity)
MWLWSQKPAGVLFPHIVASYSEDKKGAFSSRTEAGNIGNEIYSNFTLGFDYGHNIVWFDPAPEAPHQPIPYSHAGMSLYKQSPGSFTVASVLPNAPAAEAGIAVGDEIVAVDGTAARELSGWDMRRIVRKEVGTKLTLEIMRAGQKRSVIVTLRELLI